MARARSRFAAIVGVTALMCMLAACAPPDDSTTEGTPSASPEESSASPAPSVAPTLAPEGTATENQAYFDAVNQSVLAENPDAMGMDFINALVEAGFDKANMEVTEDYSTVGNRAESIQFSVRWNDQCLIGQNGESVDGYHSAVMDVLDAGTCLVGNTRAIE